MERTDLPVEVYLERLPADVRQDVRTLDAAIAGIFAGDERVIWSGTFWGGGEQTIIGYGAYRYRRSDRAEAEWFRVGLALQKRYISVYINAVEDGEYVARKHADTLGKVKVGSSSVSFRRLDDLNLDALLELVRIAKQQHESGRS